MASSGVALGNVPCDRVDAGAGVALQGANRSVAGAGQQHWGGGADLRVVRESGVPQPVQGPAAELFSVSRATVYRVLERHQDAPAPSTSGGQ